MYSGSLIINARLIEGVGTLFMEIDFCRDGESPKLMHGTTYIEMRSSLRLSLFMHQPYAAMPIQQTEGESTRFHSQTPGGITGILKFGRLFLPDSRGRKRNDGEPEARVESSSRR